MDEKDWDKIADRYEEEIISPFQEGVINPLYDAIRAIPDRTTLTAIDLGCGTGPLLPFLSRNFKSVVAVDFSPRMIEKARERVDAKNISYHCSSLADLAPFHGQIDVAVSVNSILFPSSVVVNQMLTEIHRVLKPEGRFVAIFPAMEAILYRATLVFDREIEKVGDEVKALQSTKRILERRKFDFISATYDDNGQRQKFFYDFELSYRLRKAGFKNFRRKKVLYPWGEEAGSSEDFTGHPRLWDWFVEAQPKN